VRGGGDQGGPPGGDGGCLLFELHASWEAYKLVVAQTAIRTNSHKNLKSKRYFADLPHRLYLWKSVLCLAFVSDFIFQVVLFVLPCHFLCGYAIFYY
jgi:hypothetical protein